jgi:arylsulfatase
MHALPEDIARYRGKYRDGWDALRQKRFARQKELGLLSRDVKLSPRDPIAKAWEAVPKEQRDEWDLRMAVYAAMIDRMDQGIGRVLQAVRKMGAEKNTVVFFLSDNGASAEFLDTWPNPARGHKPGSITGTRDSHHCLEVGWANAANTPFREHKMWVHEGGISTPLIVYWPAGITENGKYRQQVGHVTDLMPTCLDLAGATYPKELGKRHLIPLPGRSLIPAFQGKPVVERILAWEHEGNRAIRVGDWKLVAAFRGPWELYDLKTDRSETTNLAAKEPERVKDLAERWQKWGDDVGVVPWEKLPGGNYKPSANYRKKSEPVAP